MPTRNQGSFGLRQQLEAAANGGTNTNGLPLEFLEEYDPPSDLMTPASDRRARIQPKPENHLAAQRKEVPGLDLTG